LKNTIQGRTEGMNKYIFYCIWWLGKKAWSLLAAQY